MAAIATCAGDFDAGRLIESPHRTQSWGEWMHRLPRPRLGLVALLVASWAHANVIHVKLAATGAGDGTSWADAFEELQAALLVAMPGDEVWVAAGVYRPTPDGDRNIAFALPDGVALYGGFAGDETERSQRDWFTNETILSGDLNGDDQPEFLNRTDNSYQVVTAHDVGHETLLDGFVITGGHADGPGFGASPASKEQGSGINIYHGHPLVRNCVLRANWALNHGTVNDHGGATFVRCIFRDNYSAGFGGGLYVHHDVSTTATECAFIDNEAAHEGGGAYTRSEMNTEFHDCVFQGNRAQAGAGFYHAPHSHTHVESCDFRFNTATFGGGGIYSDQAEPVIEACIFYQNSAGVDVTTGGGGVGGSGGGGIFATAGMPTIEHCTFVENVASFGAGVYFNEHSVGSVSDCYFAGGRAAEAGGLYSLGSTVAVERCVFLDNVAEGSTFSVGGAVSAYFAEADVRDCTFADNHAELGGGGLYCEGASPRVINCRFMRNSAFGEVGWGGGLMNGYLADSSIVNCTFVGNSANRGGAIVNMFVSTPRIVNCTIAHNDAAIEGGAIANIDGSEARVANSILWSNTPDEISGTPLEATYLCVQGGYPGVGNLDADPAFKRPAGTDNVLGTIDDDLRLMPHSPCIDAGSNALVPADITFDLDGLPRFADEPFVADSGDGAAPIVDIGAYESRPCAGDVNGDRAIDLSDLAVLLVHFGQATGAAWTDGDLTGDGSVALEDLGLLLSRFGGSCE